ESKEESEVTFSSVLAMNAKLAFSSSSSLEVDSLSESLLLLQVAAIAFFLYLLNFLELSFFLNSERLLLLQLTRFESRSVTSRVFRIPVDPGLAGLVANYAGHQQCVGVQVGDVDFVLAAMPSVVVRRLFRNASLVGYPRFFVSQARVFVVLGVLSRYWCCTVEVCVVFLDTLTPVFELYVRLRERRQWDSDFPEFVLVSLTLEVPGIGLQLCVCRCGVGWSPQLFDFFLVERQLDLSSVTARLRGCSCVVLSGLDIGLISQ
ncbi:hypothetical protein Taro_007262, partial [Colocasia esculenta]|nr:hypothetical protein [Colocasia esculenta]